MTEPPEWKKRALADPSLGERQVEILVHGPKSLSEAWFLQAMKFKYLRKTG
jgi:hypothetical protein